MSIEKINSDWKLRNISISFREGYKHYDDYRKYDRYEGTIKFENGDEESFQFKVKPDMAQKYIDLIAEDIVIAAIGLGERLKESLLNKQTNEQQKQETQQST